MHSYRVWTAQRLRRRRRRRRRRFGSPEDVVSLLASPLNIKPTACFAAPLFSSAPVPCRPQFARAALFLTEKERSSCLPARLLVRMPACLLACLHAQSTVHSRHSSTGFRSTRLLRAPTTRVPLSKPSNRSGEYRRNGREHQMNAY